MIQITAENKKGERIKLTQNNAFALASVTGLTPPVANINTATLATKDGSVYVSSLLQNRNIVLTLYPRQTIEATRVNLYKYFRAKQYIKLYITTALRNVWIEGYIESMDSDLYENPQKMQISIICPDPYFKSINQTVVEFSNITGAFTFPVAFESAGQVISEVSQYTQADIYNESDDDTGVIVELYASGAVTNPTLTNETTGESFTVNFTMAEGDEIVINTKRGEKSLTHIDSGGTTTNIINSMDPDSDWFTLTTGDNIFNYSAEEGANNLTVRLILQPIFEGV